MNPALIAVEFVGATASLAGMALYLVAKLVWRDQRMAEYGADLIFFGSLIGLPTAVLLHLGPVAVGGRAFAAGAWGHDWFQRRPPRPPRRRRRLLVLPG